MSNSIKFEINNDINNRINRFYVIFSTIFMMINFIYSQDQKAQSYINCLKVNFQSKDFKADKSSCLANNNNCCHISLNYSMGNNFFDNSYCFNLLNLPEGTNNKTTTNYGMEVRDSLLSELSWFANWTINNFPIYQTIGMNYEKGKAPLPQRPICIPPQPAPAPTVYCPNDAVNPDTTKCTKISNITKWGDKPAIINIAKAYYDLYLTPALFLPPCQEVKNIDIQVTCPPNYITKGSFLSISTLIAILLNLF